MFASILWPQGLVAKRHVIAIYRKLNYGYSLLRHVSQDHGAFEGNECLAANPGLPPSHVFFECVGSQGMST